MKEYIAVIEDEPDISDLIVHHLRKASFTVEPFSDSESFFDSLDDNQPNLILLDLMLPDADGLDVCRELKNNSNYSHIPIIMLTAKSEEMDKVVGLELGADDYITKPFSPRELVARIKAILRRVTKKEKEEEVIQIGDSIVIDLQKYQVTLNGNGINLTSTEYNILKLLVSKKGWVFSRAQILDYLWGNEKVVLDRTIDVHVKNLREKLGDAGKTIKNIRGVGYKLEE